MKVYLVMKLFLQEEDFGGYQSHSELGDIFISRRGAERYIQNQPPHEDDYYCSNLSYEIIEREVNE